MATIFIGETKRAVEQGGLVEDQSVREGAAANQAHFLELREVLDETESASRSQLPTERFPADRHFDFLRSNGGMAIIDKAVNPEFAGGVNADAAIAIGKFEGLYYTEVTAAAAQTAHARAGKQIDKRLGRAIEDGQLERVELDVDIVNFAGVESGKQMLGGGDKHALLHQAGGVADARHVADMGFDFEVIKVEAPENNARV